MRPMTREWVAKAESDYDGACEALRSRKKSRRDRICFFSQPYPGTWATLPESRSGIRTCRRFRSVARQSLGLRP